MRFLTCWKLRPQFLHNDIHVYIISMYKNSSLNSWKIVRKDCLFRDCVHGWRYTWHNLLFPQSMGSNIGDTVNIDIR